MADLLLFSPWWENPESIKSDRHVSAYQESLIQWRPDILNEFDFGQDAVYTLRGPRQVGKTTLVKVIIRDLLKSGVSPKAIFYYSCDLIPGAKEVFQLIRQYHEFSHTLKLKRRYIFLDEISLVPDWQHAVKQAIDLGWGRETTFLLTGSSAVDIKRGAERLPGRRGRIAFPDKVLLPMSFSDFVEKCSDLSLSLPQTSFEDLLEHPEKMDKIKSQTDVFLPKLSSLFTNFLHVGGFPLAVEQFLRTGSLSDDILETYLTVIRSDFEKIKKSRILLRQVLIRILSISGSPASWQSLAKSIDTPSYKTVREYSELLGDSFLMAIIYFLERNKKLANPNKGKKFYFSDPLILNLAAREAGLPALTSHGIAEESVVAIHIIRKFGKRIFEGLGNIDKVFYWRSSKGKEVDFVALYDNKILPIEVKYQSAISRSDYSTMKRSFGRGILVTKDIFFRDNQILGIPAPVFLLLIE